MDLKELTIGSVITGEDGEQWQVVNQFSHGSGKDKKINVELEIYQKDEGDLPDDLPEKLIEKLERGDENGTS